MFCQSNFFTYLNDSSLVICFHEKRLRNFIRSVYVKEYMKSGRSMGNKKKKPLFGSSFSKTLFVCNNYRKKFKLIFFFLCQTTYASSKSSVFLWFYLPNEVLQIYYFSKYSALSPSLYFPCSLILEISDTFGLVYIGYQVKKYF